MYEYIRTSGRKNNVQAYQQRKDRKMIAKLYQILVA